MERLSGALELLDGALDDPAALDGNLRDLGRVNRWLGGARLSSAALTALAGGRTDLRLIDVGTGAADIPVALLGQAAGHWPGLTVLAVDSRAEVITAAQRIAPQLAELPGLVLATSEPDRIDGPDDAFDVAHCSLVLHHLEPAAAVNLLKEMARVARLGIVVNDLDRSRLAWLGAWLMGHLLTGNRYTRHDAPMSVRRAYRLPEALELVRAAGLTPVRTFRGFFRHRYAIAAVAGPAQP
jgi:ubiquinone/menaquinone biosynthesis C-methylase UbiE